MVTVTPIRLRVEQAIEDRMFTQEPREHLGASGIGGLCGRASWYGFHWAFQEVHSARQIRLFNRGHMEELVIIEDLINIGCTMKGVNLDESIYNRFKTVFNHSLPDIKPEHKNFAWGHGGASNDGEIWGLPDAPKTPHLLEHKTSNTKNFILMKANGVRDANWVHFIQMQIYMHLFQRKRCLYVMTCKETDERYYERVKYNKKIALEYIKRGETIIQATSPPPRLSEDPEYYRCGPKWCQFRLICHKGDLPARNCRTCEHHILTDGRVVKCALTRKKLKMKKQLKGCLKYKVGRCFQSK